ncbi:RNA polymerase II associated protein 1 [Blyttiomyces sp. JEL0837]|nr:RNA polymerase II associated protein 1 [Blyttiomyces sp. JEL0837]
MDVHRNEPTPNRKEKKPSLFAQRLANKRQHEALPNSAAPAMAKMEDENVPSILADVLERDGRSEVTAPKLIYATGFPPVDSLEISEVRNEFEAQSSQFSWRSRITSALGAKPISSEMDMEIHQENMNRLMGMSERELEEAHAELLKTLSPQLIQKLQSRAAKVYGDPTAPPPPASVTEPQSMEGVEEELKAEPEDPSKSKSVSFATEQSPATEPKVEARARDDGTVRFDFRGNVNENATDDDSEHETHNHHDHSDHSHSHSHSRQIDAMDEDNLTVKDLTQLLLSRVASQKAVALRALSMIMRKIRLGKLEFTQQQAIESEFLNHITLLKVRMALDDVNVNVISNALDCIRSCVLVETTCESTAENAWYNSQNITSGRIALFCGQKSREGLLCKRGGFNVGERDSKQFYSLDIDDQAFTTISKLLAFDCIWVFLHTKVIKRMGYLVKTSRMSRIDLSNVVDILLRFCRHSSQAVDEIISNWSDFGASLTTKLIQVTWPPKHEGSLPIPNFLKLVHILCKRGGQSFTESCLSKTFLDVLMRYIIINPADISSVTSLAVDIQEKALDVLSMAFSQGLDDHIFHEYRGVFSEMALSFVRKRISGGVVGQMEEGNAPNWIQNSFWRMMYAMIEGGSVTPIIGTTDDAFYPFLNLAFETLDNLGTFSDFAQDFSLHELMTASTIFDFFQSYSVILMAKYNSLGPMDAIALKLLGNAQIKALYGENIIANFVASWVSLVSCLKDATRQDINLGPNSANLNEVLTLKPVNVNEGVLGFSLSRGINRLRGEQLRNAMKGDAGHLESAKYLKVVFDFLESAGPGDEDFSQSLLNLILEKLLSDTSYGHAMKDYVIQSLVQTTAKGRNQHTDKTRTAFDFDLTHEGLPLSSDWICVPLVHFETDLLPQYEEHSANIIIESLRLIMKLDRAFIPNVLNPWLKLAHVMKVFLFPAVGNSQELFMIPEIDNLLCEVFNFYLANNRDETPAGLDVAFGQGSRFYKFYQELVSQFESVSFGNRSLCLYLVLPLSMDYAADFRLMFWAEGLTRHANMKFSADEIPGDQTRYFEPAETNLTLLNQFAQAVAHDLKDYHGCFLFKIAACHLVKYLFDSDADNFGKSSLASFVLTNIVGPTVSDGYLKGFVECGGGDAVVVEGRIRKIREFWGKR